jgi:small subunit ribosomal protein S4
MLKKPKYKLGRRLGAGVFEKCQTPKFVLSSERRARRKSDSRPKPLSEFGQQLIEKQKIRFGYGIAERQLSNYVKEAIQTKGMSTKDALFNILETRLDNVVYRFGIAHTRRLARQLVSHGHITLNGKKTTVPSTRLKIGDVVKVRDGSKGSPLFENMGEKLKAYNAPTWVSFDADALEGKILTLPKNNESFINLSSVLEFYSR